MPSNHSTVKLADFKPLVENINQARSTVVIRADKNFATAIVRRLRPYESLPRLFRPALEEMADYVREQMIPDTFAAEGPNWPQLSKRTQWERQRLGFDPKHPMLKRTGDLFKELTEKGHPNHIEVVKVGKNARIEIGGSSKKFAENQLGLRSQNLPPRPMIPGTGNIPITEAQREDLARIIRNSIKKAKH